MNSKQLFARRQEMAENQHQLMDEGQVDEARVVEGQIRELDLTLEHTLDEEDRLRSEFNKPAVPQAASFGQSILGARDEFNGLEVGFKNEADPTVVTVSSPTEIELDIPGKESALLAGFMASLPSVDAVGSVSFKQRAAQIGAPDTWAGVVDGASATKERVIYQWKDAVANKETIAGYVPVSKDTLRDYDELLAIIESDLRIDLEDKTDVKGVKGTNNNGIVGVTNTPGIQTFTTGVGGKYYDAVRMMRTLCLKNARRIPTHVCMNPDIKEAIDLYKTEYGLYQYLADDIMWGMQVIEDFNCDGIMVYDRFSARRRPIHGISVEVGYVNDQFVKNELCLLAEQTLALQVVRPDAFVCAEKADLDGE